MARGVNKAILVGNLGADPETRYTPNGVAVCNISVATSEKWTDRNTGQPQERTEWHRIVAFNRMAEVMGEYLHKGSKVYIEGKIQTRKWQDQQGNDRYTTEIVCNDMQMLDSRGGGREQDQAQQHGATPPGDPARGGSQGNVPPYGGWQGPPEGDQQGGNPPDDFDDDIPF